MSGRIHSANPLRAAAKLALALALAALCAAGSARAQANGTVVAGPACQPLALGTPPSGSSWLCDKIVDWLIPVNYSGALWTQSYVQALDEQVQALLNAPSGCPMYENAQWQCAKYFPQCNNATGAVHLLCYDSCEAASSWDHNACAGFSDAYFTTECGNTQYYSQTDQQCIALSISDGDGSNNWKWILGGIMIGVCAVLILSFAYSRFRACRLAETLIKEDAEERDRNLALRIQHADDTAAANAGAGAGARRPSAPQSTAPPPYSATTGSTGATGYSSARGGQVGATMVQMPDDQV